MKTSNRKNVVEHLSVETDKLLELGLLPVGEYVTVETINPIYHGRLLAVTPSFYVMADVSWLGDLGQRAEYESGSQPVEANYIGGSDERPWFCERSCVLTLKHAPIQKPLSERAS
jgi:hypothetical protein